jgi:hypothetical protein
MLQQLLHRANVGARLKQMRGEGVAQGVDGHWLGKPGLRGCSPDRALQALLEQMVAPLHARARVHRQRG